MTEQQPSGDYGSADYGYDLVHEEARSGKPHEAPPFPRTAPSRGQDSPDTAPTDYGYDEAHGF